MRLDVYLFEKGLCNSRNKAAEMIKNREVLVDGNVITKTSFKVEESNKVEVEEKTQYVGRAGFKLKGFLQEYKALHVKDLNCLDIGSSTGGFVQVLLESGAKSVSAVDVGSEQLHVSLRDNPRVKLYEQTDIRDFVSDEKFDLVTCDVSFIGIEQILSDIDRLSNDKILVLFKPQFEVGLGIKRTSKGVVKDALAIKRVQENFVATCFTLGWELIEKQESILKGKEGNAETFYYFNKR
ncbi:23S rRNA (cytidine-2'-O)-methyltransferase TlyA [Sulfurospirillum arcachonense]|uniref:23S rRNA (cytidine-2'-O)-methyltransferase TlyA n=1 Tax=Sulfurospirillum arcachonense TaxID=57666 RepID=UPI000468792F|nr:TlyA family RNA methyltransferase [Sulfurospirillum arcachonense]